LKRILPKEGQQERSNISSEVIQGLKEQTESYSSFPLFGKKAKQHGGKKKEKN